MTVTVSPGCRDRYVVRSDKPLEDVRGDHDCIECGARLTRADYELGFECEHCRRQWMADVTGDESYL